MSRNYVYLRAGYDLRDVRKMDTCSTDEEEEESSLDYGIEVCHESDWQARVYAISSWRFRRARRRKIYLAAVILVVFILVISLSVGLSNRKKRLPRSAASPNGSQSDPSSPADEPIALSPATPSSSPDGSDTGTSPSTPSVFPIPAANPTPFPVPTTSQTNQPLTASPTVNTPPNTTPTTDQTDSPVSRPPTAYPRPVTPSPVIATSEPQQTAAPTYHPTAGPTSRPTTRPTSEPTTRPTKNPTSRPTMNPTRRTNSPTDATTSPTAKPTARVTLPPDTAPDAPLTGSPTSYPRPLPTSPPPQPTPTNAPLTASPTKFPTFRPTVVENPIVVEPPPVVNIPMATVLSSNSLLEREEFVSSPNGDFRVGLDQTGNLVLKDRSSHNIWSAATSNGHRVFMQSDGNLIVRSRDNRALWTSHTYNNHGAILIVDDGGRIAVMKDDTPLWLDGIPRGTYSGPSSPDLSFPTRGIFYYPWFPETWTVNGQPVKFPPDIGLYSSSDPSVAVNHIDAMDYADIDLSIASWWGPETNLDRARLSLLMEKTIEMGSSLKWTIYYEDEKQLEPSVQYIRDDLDYLKKWFAWHPGWAHVDGRPIIFVFNGGGCDIINRWMDASNGEWYVVIKIFQRYWECPRQPDHWHQYGTHDGDPLQYDTYSVTLAPGFWKSDEPNPRAPRIGKDEWCEDVRQMASSTAEAWHLIVSFNEAGEGTNIEASPHWSTNTGYGYYLDCLHEYPTVRR